MKVGMYITGTGFKCCAVAGVLSCLKDNGISIDLIACGGLSSYIATLFNIGCTDQEVISALDDLSCDIKKISLFKKIRFLVLGAKKSDIISKKISTVISKKCNDKLQSLKNSLQINCTDVENGDIYIVSNCKPISNGNEIRFLKTSKLSTAIRSSMGFCDMVLPIKLDGKMLVDFSIQSPNHGFLLKAQGCDKTIELRITDSKKPRSILLDGADKNRFKNLVSDSLINICIENSTAMTSQELFDIGKNACNATLSKTILNLYMDEK